MADASLSDLIVLAELNALRDEYARSHRHYHTWVHIEALLRSARRDSMTSAAVLLAIAYHDAVYDASAKDNETKSAERLHAAWKSGSVVADTTAINAAMKMIELGEGDPQSDWFWDADREILAAPREAYNAYAAAVRKEYEIYPDFLYRRGRAQFLKAELQRPQVYRTASFQTRFEELARANLQAELDGL